MDFKSDQQLTKLIYTRMKVAFKLLPLLLTVLLVTSCAKKKPNSVKIGKESTATGLDYNQKEGFQVAKFKGQPTGPNLVYIEGGRFTMGSLEEDATHSHDNVERTVTVQSFYMDETEIANVHYLEYLYAVQRDSTQEFYEAALPDTTVWAQELAFNDSYVDQYFRYPGFRMYPVVGVSWVQCNDYAAWRTQAVNMDLAAKGAKTGSKKRGKKGAEVATTNVVPSEGGRAAIETGYVLPNYRLPTEAEWEYAAKALIGTQYIDENQSNQRIYPWDGSSVRKNAGRKKGTMLANFKRGRGDYAGIAGKSNDGSITTDEVYSFPPNDFGLYNMAGNVNEWVYDIYRPLSFQTFSDLNPIRRDGYMDEEKNYDTKNSNSLVDNRARVYKGGSWADVAYWLSPGTRRYMDQDSATAMIGFRCSMLSVGKK